MRCFRFCRLRHLTFGPRLSIRTTAPAALALAVAFLAAPAFGQSANGTMTLELSSDGAARGTSVTLDLYLEDAVDVQGYQATIQITRVAGTGEVTLVCPGGLAADETRPDYIFFGLDTENVIPGCTDCGVIVSYCEGGRVTAARVTGGVDTGATRAHLGTFMLEMSEDTRPDSAFEISIVPFPASVVTGSNYASTPFLAGPSLILGDDAPDAIPTVSVWGLVVLGLLLLTCLKIMFGRRGAKPLNLGSATAGRGGCTLFMLALVLGLAGAPSTAFGKECSTDAHCDDGDVCTYDECIGRYCVHTSKKPYGDIASADGCFPDGAIDEFDVSAIEAGAQGIFDPGCSPHNMDIKSAAGYQADGQIDLFDINAVLRGFSGEPGDGCEQGFLDLLTPREGHIVGGENVLIWAAVAATSEGPIVSPTLEMSLDGIDYEPLLQQLAPDFGVGSTTTTFDAESLPSGPLFIRASAKEKEVVHGITVDHLPTVTCSASGVGKNVEFDCSDSMDPDGSIVEYDWHFGDGTTELSTTPSMSHTYPSDGEYDFWVTATDNYGLPSTTEYNLAVAQDGEVVFDEPDNCECTKMTINIAGNSFVRDPRRKNDNGTPGDTSDDTFDTAPLGKDPKFVSFNFEVFAVVKGDARLCVQGQEVKGTGKYGTQAAQNKKACKAGRTLATCSNNADCHTYTCSGGTENGKSCLGSTLRTVCLLGGGTCPAIPGGDGNGNCSDRPFTGAVRGNDDYTAPFPADLFIKIRCPVCKTPFWLDAPGLQTTEHATATKDYRFDADFVAFMRGPGDKKDCSCHFKVVVDWDGANQTYRAATGLTLIADAETVNCNLDNSP